MSIWASLTSDRGELEPVERDNYSGEPVENAEPWFVDVATNYGNYNDCTRLVIRHGTDVDAVLLLTPGEVDHLRDLLTSALTAVRP